jgi:RNA polymerase sigma factor (sigma-70 family)
MLRTRRLPAGVLRRTVLRPGLLRPRRLRPELLRRAVRRRLPARRRLVLHGTRRGAGSARPAGRLLHARARGWFLLRSLTGSVAAAMSVGPLAAAEFEQAFARHGRALWLLASAWVGRGEAADLVQEVARLAWERRERFEPGSDERAWLAQFVRHTGANWRRRRRPMPVAPEALQPEARGEPSFARHDADALGLPDELAHGLAGLPEAARASLLLHVVGGHTFAEIAPMLTLPENTVASHVRRARLALREALPAPRRNAAVTPRTP